MAVRPDYTIGTLSLTSGSANFTTSGSSLQTAAVQAGDAIIAPSGHVLIIASITGQNSGTLFLPCPPDAAGTGLPMRIRFQPDGSRYQGAVRVLIDLLSSGNLEALAALVGAAGMVPIFTGVGTMDLADPATFGIQDPNGSLGKLAALTLTANKALTTDGSGNAQQIDLGTLGRALLALSSGANTQYVQGDGTLQDKALLPVSTATQVALDKKASLSGSAFTGNLVAQAILDIYGILKTRGDNQFGAGTIEQMRNYDYVHMWTRYIGSVSSGDGQYLTFSYTPNSTWQRDVIMMLPNGNVRIAGTLSAASKSFETDHPLDPYNKDLVYASTESPSHGIEYWGMARLSGGTVVVDVDKHYGMSPGTFQAMTAESVLFLQNQDSSNTVYRRWLDDGRFEILCDDPDCNDLVGWQVKGIRKDAVVFTLPNTNPITGKLIPEQEKPEA